MPEDVKSGARCEIGRKIGLPAPISIWQAWSLRHHKKNDVPAGVRTCQGRKERERSSNLQPRCMSKLPYMPHEQLLGLALPDQDVTFVPRGRRRNLVELGEWVEPCRQKKEKKRQFDSESGAASECKHQSASNEHGRLRQEHTTRRGHGAENHGSGQNQAQARNAGWYGGWYGGWWVGGTVDCTVDGTVKIKPKPGMPESSETLSDSRLSIPPAIEPSAPTTVGLKT